ncbi:Contactin-associated protein-like 2 [Stylophora pistillata]|uniref:Contactin-associated protein-like 2 n=1 Tax=Stylophora pistillata TaxID=50429 RepID=A0A2B4RY26_STYPI|nr:Contactin-associated protein-like 2 [Stylophora pistillata]
MRYLAYLGGSHEVGQLDIVHPQKNLNDGKWHSVTVLQYGRKAEIYVDSVKNFQITREVYKDFGLKKVYVGGMSLREYRSYVYSKCPKLNFRGCIEDLTFRGKNIIEEFEQDPHPGYDLFGQASFKCKEIDYRVVTVSSPNEGFKVTVKKLPIDNDTFSASFRFRTHVEKGLLLSRSAIKVKLHIRLSGGSLLYDVIAPNGSRTELAIGTNLDDGEWHSEFSNKSRLKIFLGGYDQEKRIYPGFVGCFLNLQIDSQKISLQNLKISKHTRDDPRYVCGILNQCQPNPCKNGGKCSQDWERFHCDCTYTQFEGDKCEVSKYRPTCEFYRSLGLKKSVLCLLDSQGDGKTYTAFCNITSERKRTYTVITHDKMKKIRVGNTFYRMSSYYKHHVTYSDSIEMEQITQLIERSKECRQHIRFHCFTSKLLNTPRGPSHAFWLSRNDSKQEYWGGAEPGSKKCACGSKKPPSCVGPGKMCNCDSKDNHWRVDEGYLTDKSSLPVRGLLFHQKSEKSDFSLGPLECWGNSYQRKIPQKPSDRTNNEILALACPSYHYKESTSSSTRPDSPTATLRSPTVRSRCPSEERCLNSSSTSVLITTKSPTVTPEMIRQEEVWDEGEISTIAIVMISAALVVIVLLSMKFALPRVIMCIRTHSKRGEYIVPPSGSSGYTARLLPIVAKKSSIRGRQLTQHSGNGKYVEGNAAAGLKSYWV